MKLSKNKLSEMLLLSPHSWLPTRRRKKKTRLSKSKSEVGTEEADVGEDDDEQKKKATSATKYPSKCSLVEAHLFFPTSDKTVHETGVDGKLIRSENLLQYRGHYCCLYKGCDYGAQTQGNTLSHI